MQIKTKEDAYKILLYNFKSVRISTEIFNIYPGNPRYPFSMSDWNPLSSEEEEGVNEVHRGTFHRILIMNPQCIDLDMDEELRLSKYYRNYGPDKNDETEEYVPDYYLAICAWVRLSYNVRLRADYTRRSI